MHKNVIEKLHADAGGYIYSYYSRHIGNKISCFYYSLIMRILLSIKKIKFGKGIKFYGKPHIVRHPESIITIGDYCVFDSSKFHNLIGVDKCCVISTLNKNAQLHIENSCGFSGVRISCAEKITIGKDCTVGANVTITDTDWHGIEPEKRWEESAIKTKPVRIGNNVFLGLNTIILKGVEIGDNAVIGAGSVVASNIPANVIAAGNPCKVIKAL